MNKYIVWCPTRCGSMLVANIIWLAYFAGDEKNSVFTEKTDYYTGNAPVIHTHSQVLFLNGSPNYKKIVMTRPIIDSVLSKIIADKTKIYHLRQNTFDFDYNKKFLIDIEQFVYLCYQFDRNYTNIYNSKVDCQIINYDDIKSQPLDVLKIINDPRPINYNFLKVENLPIKNPIASIDRISNAEEILDKYSRFSLQFSNGFYME